MIQIDFFESYYLCNNIAFSGIRINSHTHTDIHVNKLVDNTCNLLEKQIRQPLSCKEYLIFYQKANHYLTQI